MTVRQAFQRVAEAVSEARRCAASAEQLAGGIVGKDLAQVQLALGKADAETSFKVAFEKLGDIDATSLRKRYPHLYGCDKTTPLSLAVIKGFYAGAEALLAAGAQPFHETALAKSGYTGALAAAIFRGDAEMIGLFMRQPRVQQELAEKPAFRDFLLLAAVGADNANTLKIIAECDPLFMEKARAYGTLKPSDFTLGTGIINRAQKASGVPLERR